MKFYDSNFFLNAKKKGKIIILSKGKNLGIAKALNLSLQFAKNRNFRYILTMDQDSFFEEEQIRCYIKDFNNTSKSNLAIFSLLHNKKFVTDKIIEQDCVMTSGNIVNVDIALKIGAFDEKLFIDEVDHEFCFRVRENNYKIIQTYKSFLNHTLGIKKGNIVYYPANRIYYMIRNYLYVRKKYKFHFRYFFKKRDKYLLKFYCKQLIYTKNKIKYILMLSLAIKDFLFNKMGYRVKL